jgi:hypothetical protein
MQMTIYNTNKQRLETVEVEITDENTTWFDDNLEADSIYRITDFQDGLLIKENNYTYPILIDGVTRTDIGDNWQKAKQLLAALE